MNMPCVSNSLNDFAISLFQNVQALTQAAALASWLVHWAGP